VAGLDLLPGRRDTVDLAFFAPGDIWRQVPGKFDLAFGTATNEAQEHCGAVRDLATVFWSDRLRRKGSTLVALEHRGHRVHRFGRGGQLESAGTLERLDR
jgi:hypothetical protein